MQVQAAMEGAASAANSRGTSRAASRVPSPDLQVPQHPNMPIHAHPLEDTDYLQGKFPTKLASGSDKPAQASSSAEHDTTAAETANSNHSISEADQHSHDLLPPKTQGEHVTSGHEQALNVDSASAHNTSHVALQPSSKHSSPAVSRQRSHSPSAIAAAPAAANSTSAEPSKASSPSAAHSAGTHGTSRLPGHVSSQASVSQSRGRQGTSAQQSPVSDARQPNRPHGSADYAYTMSSSSSFGNRLRQSGHLRRSTDASRMADAQQMQTMLQDALSQQSSICPGNSAEGQEAQQSLPARQQSGPAQSTGSLEYNSEPMTLSLGSAGRRASEDLDAAASSVQSVSISIAQSPADSHGSLQAHSMHSAPPSMHSTPHSMHSSPPSMHSTSHSTHSMQSSLALSASPDAASAEDLRDTAALPYTATSADSVTAKGEVQDDCDHQSHARLPGAANTLDVSSAEGPHASFLPLVTPSVVLPEMSAVQPAEHATEPDSPATQSCVASQSGSCGQAMRGTAQQDTAGQASAPDSQCQHSTSSPASSAVGFVDKQPALSGRASSGTSQVCS